MGGKDDKQLDLKTYYQQTRALKLGFDKELTRLKLDPKLMADLKKLGFKLEKDLNRVGKAQLKNGKIDLKPAQKPIEKAGKSCCKLQLKYKDTTDPTSLLPKALQSRKGVISLSCGLFNAKITLKPDPKKGIKVEGFVGLVLKGTF